MPRTAILLEGWSTTMENWLCLPLDGTISTCRSTYLLSKHWKDPSESERPRANNDSDPCPRTRCPRYRVRRRDFQPDCWWRHYDLFDQKQLQNLHVDRSHLLWRVFDWRKKDNCLNHLMNQRDKADLIANSTCLKRAFHSKSSLVINTDSKTFLSNVVKFTPL